MSEKKPGVAAKEPHIKIIDIDGPLPHPAVAPPIVDNQQESETSPQVTWARPSWLSRILLGLLVAVLGTFVTGTIWNFSVELIETSTILGWTFISLLASLILGFTWGEATSYHRLQKMTGLQQLHKDALHFGDANKARRLVQKIATLYRKHPQLQDVAENLVERVSSEVDAEAMLALAESQLMQPLDALAEQEVVKTVRRVAVLTAVMPAPALDLLTVLGANFMMVRRVAEIYCGRPGALGSWRIARRIVTHLASTAAMSILGETLAGSWMSKLVGRLGEGAINGALTARIGLTAIDVCRPMQFQSESASTSKKRPGMLDLLVRAIPELGKKELLNESDDNKRN